MPGDVNTLVLRLGSLGVAASTDLRDWTKTIIPYFLYSRDWTKTIISYFLYSRDWTKTITYFLYSRLDKDNIILFV